MSVDELLAENLKAELAGLRGILSSAGSYVYTKDLESRYTYVNPLTCDLFGAPFEQIVGQGDARFFGPEVAEHLRASDLLVLTTGETQFRQERLVFPATGETRFYLAVKAPLYDEQGQLVGICGVSTDITAQKHLETRLEDSHMLLHTVLDNVEANIYVKDAQGRYLYANQGTLELFRLTPEAVLGHTDAELFPAETAQAFKAADDKVFATGQPQRVEETYRDGSGRLHHYWSTKLLLRRAEQPDALIGLSTDITPLKDAEMAVARSEARFRALFESSSEALVLIANERFLDCNEAALRLMGVSSKAAFLTLTPADLSPPQQACGTASAEKARALMEQALAQGRLQFEWTLRRHDDGNPVAVEAVVTAIPLDDGPALLVSVRDLTERKRYEEQIIRLGHYDSLTQLPNRRLFYDRLSQALAQHRRSNQHGCVIYLDLDNFKSLNDRHGHVAGDRLLQEVGRRLVGCLRAQDTVARFGGDEFVVLLNELDKSWDVALKQAQHVAQKMLAELARSYVLTLNQGSGPTQTVEHRCTASLGVHVFRPSDSQVDPILRLADDAMYQAKAKGRNQVWVTAQ